MPLARQLLLCSFVLLIFGSKLWLLRTAGSDLPVLDQWDGEATRTLVPWLENRLTLQDLFAPHNEHRIVTTRLYALTLLALNGQWSGFVETVPNAAIHTIVALLLLLGVRNWLSGAQWAVLAGLLLLLFGLPFSWENTLVGFQIQFYFLLLFSFCHLHLTLRSNQFSIAWFLGQICGGLALISMASGFFAAAGVISVLVYRLVNERRWTAQQTVSAAIAVVTIVTGWLMKEHVPGHDVLKSTDVATFLKAFATLVAWPCPIFLPLTVIPAVLFVIRLLRKGARSTADHVLLGALVWVFLQCAALAYGRGNGVVLASRYLDLLSINVALGFLFAVREITPRWRFALTAGWLAAIGIALVVQTREQWEDQIIPITAFHRQQEKVVRNYLRTGDTSLLLDKTWPEIPYPDSRLLIGWLNLPIVRKILPPSVRLPVSLEGATASASSPVSPSLDLPPQPIAWSSWQHPAERPLTWRSLDQPESTLPILRFWFAGEIDPKSTERQVTVHGASSSAKVVPARPPEGRWKSSAVLRPEGRWHVEAEDGDSRSWFAFTEPVELGIGSWLAEKTIKHHALFITAAALLGVIGGILRFSLHTKTGRRAILRPEVCVGTIAVLVAAGLLVSWLPTPRASTTALKRIDLSTDPAIETSAWPSGAIWPATALSSAVAGLQTTGSYVGGDAFTGEHRSDWYRVTTPIGIFVAGYPASESNSLALEVRLADGNTATLRFTGKNPGEQWTEWRPSLPATAEAVRIHAVDGMAAFQGWLGFSEPYTMVFSQPPVLRPFFQTLTTIVIALLLVLGPGILWHAKPRRSLVDVIWPGPLLLATGGLLAWCTGGIVPPATTALVWVLATLCGVLCLATRDRVWEAWSRTELKLFALVAIVVIGASAKAGYSGGPPGELYGGQISRSLEIGDRSDSRISYHTVQLVAHHLSPFEPEGSKYFLPWLFSARGPLGGLAAAPIVLSLGCQPPLIFPDQPWAPFDPEGFVAYRIVMMTLAALALVAVAALLQRLASEQHVWIGVGLVALSPFFWHEVYFTWPKLIAAAFVLGGFHALLNQRVILSALWLGAGYLWHPLALLSVPFFQLWLLFGSERRFLMRFKQAVALGLVVVGVMVAWLLINGRSGGQNIFFQYFRAADGVYDVSIMDWCSSRAKSVLNTFVPLHVLFTSADNPSFNAIGTRSSGIVHFFFQYWTSAPFAVGFTAFCALLPAFVSGIRRAPRVALTTLVLPTIFLALYWGVTVTGLMREAGHVLFLSGWVFLVWASADEIPAWVHTRAFVALRAIEIIAMMFVPSIIGGKSGESWLVNDTISIVVATICVGSVAWLISDSRNENANTQGSVMMPDRLFLPHRRTTHWSGDCNS